MSNVKVGSVIDIPISKKETWKGVIERIDDTVDPRLKYKVSFIGQNIVMFFSEQMIRRCIGN